MFFVEQYISCHYYPNDSHTYLRVRGTGNMQSSDSPANTGRDFSVEDISHTLQESHPELVLNSLPVGVAVLHMPGYILEIANSTFARMVGKTSSEHLHLGSSLKDALPRQWADLVVPLVEQAIETENRVTVCKVESAAKDGASDGYWLVACQPIPSQGSGASHAIIFSQDISEQSVLLKKLQALNVLGSSLSRGYSLDEFLNDGVAKCASVISADYCAAVLLDKDSSRLLRVAESKALGWIPVEIAVESVPEWSREIRTSDSNYISLPAADDREAKWLANIGAYGYLSVPLMTVGKPIGTMVSVFEETGYSPSQEDIEFAELVAERCALAITTERVMAEYGRLLSAEQAAHRAASEKAAQMEALLESLECGVILYDRDGYVLLSNRANEEMLDLGDLGSRRGDDIAFNITLHHLDGRTVSAEERPYSKLMREGVLVDQDYIMDCADGSRRVISFNGGIVRDSKDRMSSAILILRDITQLHEIEKTKEEMVRLISHDLRSPLTLILARAQMLEHLADRPDAIRKNAAGIIRSAKYMNIMISDLTDSFRLESGRLSLKRQALDFEGFFSDCMDHWVDVPDVTRLKQDIEPNLPLVYADPVRLERILTNLTTNAFKYSPRDSEVLLRAVHCESSNKVVISVTDHGQGIDQEELPHIFERYYRATKAQNTSEGLGLGLYISKGLVEAHEGRIWAESVPGKGSTFLFTLPVAE